MPDLTPDGHVYNPVDPQTIDDCWLTAADYPNLVAYSLDPAKAPFLDQYIIEACAMVNGFCHRKFNLQLQDQIFINTVLNIRDYTTFTLFNRPLVEVTNMWVEVTNSFAPISLEFLQVLTYESSVKILPNFSVYAQTTLPMWALPTSTNFWIRFRAGYDKTTIPPEVRRATALLVDWLFASDSITGNVTSFRTQTYSETAAGFDNDPILTRAYGILKKYKINTLVA